MSLKFTRQQKMCYYMYDIIFLHNRSKSAKKLNVWVIIARNLFSSVYFISDCFCNNLWGWLWIANNILLQISCSCWYMQSFFISVTIICKWHNIRTICLAHKTSYLIHQIYKFSPISLCIRIECQIYYKGFITTSPIT